MKHFLQRFDRRSSFPRGEFACYPSEHLLIPRIKPDLSVLDFDQHYPPGTSKWNTIEPRMVSFISMNWKGEPLVNFETVVKMIGATKTRQGLRVKAVLDKGRYETGLKIGRKQMEALNIQPHRQNPEWNYSLPPRSGQSRNE